MWTSDVCPPETSSATSGGSTSGSANTFAKMCPSRWFTPTSGLPVAIASPFAYATPTTSAPMSPGACVTAIASRLREGQRAVEPECGARALHRLVDDADDRLGVLAARDLGHDAAEAGVEVDLACDHVGEQLAPAPHHRCGGLVARRLDGEDELVDRPSAASRLGRRAGRPT